MAPVTKLLDVWIVESNTVYREVPFTVVADWVQQGRLLGDDKIRLTGKDDWRALSHVSAFAPYFPREEPAATGDTAEALEPVELGFAWRPPDEDDDDVDMIPLIDISLVLLIFFMMTASVETGLFSPIQTPGAIHQNAAIANGQLWVGLDNKDRGQPPQKDGSLWFSLGLDQKELVAPTQEVHAVLAGLEEQLRPMEGEVRMRLRAEQSLRIEAIREMTALLQQREAEINRQRGNARPLRLVILAEVSEPAK